MRIKMKRTLTILMSVMLVGTLFAGCKTKSEGTTPVTNVVSSNLNKTGFPIVKEKVTLKVMMPIQPNQPALATNKFIKTMEEKSNVHLEIEEVPFISVAEKKNLALASSSYPDIFFKIAMSDSDETTYGGSGTFLPLEKLIDNYAPNYKAILEKRPEVEKAMTLPSGHMYTLPTLDDPSMSPYLLYNEKWAKALGIKAPTTVDELYSMLKQFKEKDPNGNGKADEIPLSLVETRQVNNLMIMFGLNYNESNVFVRDKKVLDAVTQPEYKELLKFMRKLYAEGLLDKDSFTQNQQQQNAKGLQKDVILGSFVSPAAFVTVGLEKSYDYTPTPVIKSSKGEQIWRTTSGIRRGGFAITDKCKTPEVAMRWVDYLYSEEGAMLAFVGKEGEEYKVGTNGTWDWIIAEGQTQTSLRLATGLQGGGPLPILVPREFMSRLKTTTAYVGDKDALAKKPFAKVPYPMVYLSQDNQKRVTSICTDILGYTEQTIAKVVTGSMDIDKEWDTYTSTIKKMGEDELIKIYQDAYDEYSKR